MHMVTGALKLPLLHLDGMCDPPSGSSGLLSSLGEPLFTSVSLQSFPALGHWLLSTGCLRLCCGLNPVAAVGLVSPGAGSRPTRPWNGFLGSSARGGKRGFGSQAFELGLRPSRSVLKGQVIVSVHRVAERACLLFRIQNSAWMLRGSSDSKDLPESRLQPEASFLCLGSSPRGQRWAGAAYAQRGRSPVSLCTSTRRTLLCQLPVAGRDSSRPWWSMDAFVVCGQGPSSRWLSVGAAPPPSPFPPGSCI